MKDKLMVQDDEDLILKSLEHLLEDDYEVLTTSEAETALAMALKHEPAVILCDERMPGVSGHAFLRRLKEVSIVTRILMSGYADMDALTEAVNSGQIFAYVTKPWEPLKLKAKVAAATNHFKLVREVDEERSLLRALMENIPDLIYFKDCQSRFTRVNQAHARHLGIEDAAECIGKSNADYFEREEMLRWQRFEEELLRSGQPQVDRIEHLDNPRGGAAWWSTTKVPMFDRSGQVSGIASISRNITALKNSEEMLREQSERNRMILETANDAFIGMGPDGSISAWNPQAERTFGWTAGEVMGRDFEDLVLAPSSRRAGVHFLTTAQGPLPNRTFELVAVHRDGREFPAEATVWMAPVGGAASFNAFVRDITERRRAEEVRRKETTLVKLLQSVTVAANRSSSIEHTTQTCLHLICSHTGWPVGHFCLREKHPPEDLISAGIWHIDDDARFAAFRAACNGRCFAKGVGLPGIVLASGKPEWIVDLSDEELFPNRSRAAVEAGLRSGFCFPVIMEASIIGVLEFFSTQTEEPDEQLVNAMGQIASQLGQVIRRQRAEADLLRAKAAAESANRAKSQFLTTMSHEMRTPMNAILGMADLLSESSLQEEQRKYVRVFQKAGASLLSLISDILDLSKVESGYVELESIGFDLPSLLGKIIDMMRSRAQDRGLELTFEVTPGVPLGLVGDPNRLRQILINLIGNALKFTEHGSVTLRVEPDPEGGPGWLRFNVVDTGIGIDAEKTEMIFGRFTQADSSTTRKYGGTGLGLAISKGLVELMGGRIGCTSEVGKGSMFFVAAPFGIQEDGDTLEPADPVAMAAPPRGLAEEGDHRILIVEDSEYNLLLVEAYLKDCGFELDSAENGKVAVEKVISTRPHLVLMDLQMPVMDGIEATRTIREWEARNNVHPIPILALTAHAAGEGIGKSLEAGCSEHLTKPIKKAILLDAVYRHLGGKIRITPPAGIGSLIPRYLENVRRDMDAILASVDSKDCTVARRLAHQMKGSGEGYGFPEITRTGAAIELAATAANEDEIRRQILALATYLDRVEIVA